MTLLTFLVYISIPVSTPYTMEASVPQVASAAQQSGNGPRRPRDGWSLVGVYLGDVTDDRAREMGLVETSGVIVGMVEEGSPAAGAGILPNDCILTLDGVTINNRLQFFRTMVNTAPGRKVRLGILRGGQRLEIEVETGERPSPALLQRRRLFSEADSMLRMADENRRLAEDSLARGDQAGATRYRETEATLRQMSEDNRAYIENEMREGRISEPIAVQTLNLNMMLASKRYALGLTVVRLTPQLAAFFRTGDTGLLVSDVRVGGVAEQSGIRAGDCLVRLNNAPLRNISDFSQAVDRVAVSSAQGGQVEFSLTLIREGVERTLSLKF
jgi:predicted metalloprotease with PDZ domain